VGAVAFTVVLDGKTVHHTQLAVDAAAALQGRHNLRASGLLLNRS
jgi:hypothetical protein